MDIEQRLKLNRLAWEIFKGNKSVKNWVAAQFKITDNTVLIAEEIIQETIAWVRCNSSQFNNQIKKLNAEFTDFEKAVERAAIQFVEAYKIIIVDFKDN